MFHVKDNFKALNYQQHAFALFYSHLKSFLATLPPVTTSETTVISLETLGLQVQCHILLEKRVIANILL